MTPRLLSINNYHYRRGGAEVVFLEQNRLLEEAGWQVVPFAMQHPLNLPSAWESYFVEEIEFGRDYTFLEKIRRGTKVVYSHEARAKLRRLLDAVQPQIAHVHNIYHHISPSILPELKRAGVPIVMTVHDLKLACPSYKMLVGDKICERCRGGRIHNVVVNRCIKGSLGLSGLVMAETLIHRSLQLYGNVDRFITPSRFYADKLVEWGWSRDCFVHIPNFVDTAQFRPQEQVGKAFVYVGRLSSEKGLHTLVRAAALARVPVVLVGTGPIADELRLLADHVEADVRFLGHLTGADLHAAISSSRAVVLPSTWYENAPISLMEAYALGRPVIGSAIGGIPELIREGETGSTVPPGEVELLASELARFAAQPDSKLRDMGLRGRAWMEADFSVEVYRDRIVDLYASMR